MNNNKLLQGLCICGVAVMLASCSANKNAKSTSDNTVKKYRVETQQKKPVSAPNTVAPKEATTEDVFDAYVKLFPKPKKQARRPVQKRVVHKARVTNKYKRPAKRYTPRRVAKRAAPRSKVPNYRAPVRNIRYPQLSGYYASNPQTVAFINKMSSKHGFDKGYLNYLFSKTQSTPFLQRMAYNDAHPTKRKNRKSRSGSWNRYRGNFLTNRTISKGVQFWRQNRVALKRAEQQFGVPEEYILGIIGVETRYGGNVGKNRAIDALSAMGFENSRRGKYFKSELESYLLMTRSARLDPLKPMASYAGALGLSQFMPSNIKRYAVDHDRSGTVNLWTPADAIGSVANYFKKHGWRKGGTVAVKANSTSSRYKTLRTGFKSSHSLSKLRSRGVSSTHGLGNISGKASLIKLNTYSGDELWLGGKNFYVITRYNHSTHYAMAVHQLAQAIKGRIGGRNVIRQASIDVPAGLL